MSLELISKLVGISQLQAAILLQMLEEGGETTAPNLYTSLRQKSEIKRVNRTSIYLTLDELQKMGLVDSIEGLKRQKSYTLTYNNPEEIIQKILQPQEGAKTVFIDRMKEALEEE